MPQPSPFRYYDLDYDLEQDDPPIWGENEVSNNRLHLRMPSEAENQTSQHSVRSNGVVNAGRSSVDDDPLWLQDITGESYNAPYAEGAGCEEEEDDAVLSLVRELDDAHEQKHATRFDRLFHVFGKVLVIWPCRFCPGSVFFLLAMTSLTAVVGWQSYVHFPPQRILDDILDDASKGFETRGTDIRKAMITGVEIVQQLHDDSKALSLCPDVEAAALQFNIPLVMPPMPPMPTPMTTNSSRIATVKAACFGQSRGTRSVEGPDKAHHVVGGETRDPQPETRDPQSETRDPQPETRDPQPETRDPQPAPVLDIGQSIIFVFESTAGNGDLLNVKAIHSLCDVTNKTLLPMFPKKGPFQYGQHMHLGDFIVAYSKEVENCHDIEQQHINAFREQLYHCSFYLQDPTGEESEQREKINATLEKQLCIMESLELFLTAGRYLVDVDFIRHTDPHRPIKYSSVIITNQAGVMDGLDDEQTEFYKQHLDGKKISQGNIRLTAVKFPLGDDLKFNMFQVYIVSDMLWFVLAFGLVFIIMLIYLMRIDLVFATLFSIISGFILAYAAYFTILGTPFFPFLNILGLLILIAIGADDVFVFFDSFEQVRFRHPHWELHKIMGRTLSHAVPSIFVTSFTTASAFYANTISNITSVQCFGFFAGTAVLMNFFVMILVVPSVIVLSEFLLRLCNIEKWRLNLAVKSGKFMKLIFGQERNTPRKILKYTWPIWLIGLALLGIGAAMIVFVKPRFQLPVTSDLQLFPSSNLLENWDLQAKNHFLFQIEEESVNYIKLYYIWGFISEDPGNHLDPDSRYGDVKRDEAFDFYKPATQKWLHSYCRDILASDVVIDSYNSSKICTFDAYEHVIAQLCDTSQLYYSFINESAHECCDRKTVPFTRNQLQNCAPLYEYLYRQPISLKVFGVYQQLDFTGGKTIFGNVLYELSEDATNTNEVVGYYFNVYTKFKATFQYDIMDKYHDKLAVQFQSDLVKAPQNVQNGFCAYTDWFWFYDLQHSLASGTYYSIGLSLAVGFLVMLLTSFDFVITLYAMITIGLAITCTVAALVLMGWHLNIVESVIISLSVGLSIDFTIHYGVAYRHSKEQDSKSRTCESYARVGPAVLMAAMTTFLAGSAMLPCHVLAYTKLGIFLMLVMTFAWIYATFFFQSLCWFIGPPRGYLKRLVCCCGCVCAAGSSPRRDARAQLSVQADDVTALRPIDNDSDDESLLVTF